MTYFKLVEKMESFLMMFSFDVFGEGLRKEEKIGKKKLGMLRLLLIKFILFY